MRIAAEQALGAQGKGTGAGLRAVPASGLAARGAALCASGEAPLKAELGLDEELKPDSGRPGKGWLALAVAGLLLLAAAWWAGSSEIRRLQDELDRGRAQLRSLGKDARAIEHLQKERNALAAVGKKLDQVTADRPPVLMALAEVARQAPGNLIIRDVSYDPAGGLSLQGMCADDGSLGVFLQGLESSGIFAGVELVQSDWTDSGDGAAQAVNFRAQCSLNRVRLL